MDKIVVTPKQLVELVSKCLSSVLNAETASDFVNTDEALRLLECSNTTLWRHRKAGRLIEYAATGEILFRRSDILWLKAELSDEKEAANG